MGMISLRLLDVAGALAASVSIAQPPDTPVRMTAAPDRCADLAEKRDLGTLPLRKEPLVSRLSSHCCRPWRIEWSCVH